MVGGALKDVRQKIYLTSKSTAGTKAGVLRDLDTSLQTIGTDHLDIWYLHAKQSAADLKPELLEAQQEAKKAGKIRFAGVSTHKNQAEVIQAAIAAKLDVVLTSYNFAMDEGLKPALAAANKAGLGVVAMKVMAGGTRFSSFYPTPEELRKRLEREGSMLAALKWVLQNKDVHTTIPSMADHDQLDENVRAMAEPFGAADGKMLTARLEQLRPLYCRMCGACEGQCSQGLPVADVLRYLTYAEGYGQFALGRENFLQLSSREREVRCADCTECTVRCPNGVKVARRVARAQEIFA